MLDSKNALNFWTLVPSIYAVLLGVSILIGIPISNGSNGNAVQMPLLAPMIAVLIGISGVGIILRKDWARYLFIFMAPWATIALGSVFAKWLWQEDVPYTRELFVVYIACTFMLSRADGLQVFGVQNTSWKSRGGQAIMFAAIIMIAIRIVVGFSKPSPSGGGGLYGLKSYSHALNTYVQYLVLCDIPILNYLLGLAAVSIPTRKITPTGSERPVLSFEDYCPKCKHYQESTSICTYFSFNVEQYPNRFNKKCNGEYFSETELKISNPYSDAIFVSHSQ